ncbi:MAG: hypothetical protein JJE17_00395 [Peptostreptococcaceae bacterium]|nr:hypothetical protein [Peptostreptococcaceae bacterium]
MRSTSFPGDEGNRTKLTSSSRYCIQPSLSSGPYHIGPWNVSQCVVGLTITRTVDKKREHQMDFKGILFLDTQVNQVGIVLCDIKYLLNLHPRGSIGVV